MPSSVNAYCQSCKRTQEMMKLRPYNWTGRVKLAGTGGFGLTGECAVCGAKKDFVVSESLYMVLNSDKRIDNG